MAYRKVSRPKSERQAAIFEYLYENRNTWTSQSLLADKFECDERTIKRDVDELNSNYKFLMVIEMRRGTDGWAKMNFYSDKHKNIMKKDLVDRFLICREEADEYLTETLDMTLHLYGPIKY